MLPNLEICDIACPHLIGLVSMELLIQDVFFFEWFMELFVIAFSCAADAMQPHFSHQVGNEPSADFISSLSRDHCYFFWSGYLVVPIEHFLNNYTIFFPAFHVPGIVLFSSENVVII